MSPHFYVLFPKNAHVYVLDEQGELLNSIAFSSDILDKEQLHGQGASIVFVIGGPEGHSTQVRSKATACIAFGRLTIAHRIVRILLLEQIYRGFRILHNAPYHRD